MSGPRMPLPFSLRRSLVWMARSIGVLVLLLVALLLGQAWESLGQRPQADSRARIEHSPEWRDGRFRDPQPIIMDVLGSLSAMSHASPVMRPNQPVPTAPVNAALWTTPPPSGLRLTWFGHSTALIEIDDRRILIDPIWSEYASPIDWLGPQRFYEPLVALKALPPIDAVVISHDHFDHLDYLTMRAMRDWNTTFIVPLGVGAHLVYWGIPRNHIVELDWWDRAQVNGLEIVSAPARHASGRALIDRDQTLWSGYAFLGSQHRVYYSGDTGLFPGFKEIGAQLGPFDVALIEVGQYNRTWPDWHMGPEQAVLASQWLQARSMLPVHWGLFALAPHGWTEPIERAVVAAEKAGQTVWTPRPGQSFELGDPAATQRWWPQLSWNTGGEDPIVSSQVR